MRRLWLAAAGLVVGLLAFSLGSSVDFILIAAVYAGSAAALFAGREAWGFIVGLTLACELFGQAHTGLYGLFGFCAWILDILFRDRLRFTSSGIRFSIALFIELALYHLFFSSTERLSGWLDLALLYILTVCIASLRRQTAPFYAFD